MILRTIHFVTRLWPAGAVAVPFAAVYCVLLCVFPEAIQIELSDKFANMSCRRGPSVLFMMNSVLLGLATTFVLERRLGTTNAIVFFSVLPVGAGAVGAGFGAGVFLLKSTVEPITVWAYALLSLSLVLGTCVVRLRYARYLE